MKKILFIPLFICSSYVFAQPKQPKLIVGIVVDQMRYDYITRYWEKFNDGGFKKLVTNGFNCKNTHYNYMPTFTGPGHASIYSGTTPENHGIIANDWYDKKLKKYVYCAEDTTVFTVGSKSKDGLMSPSRLLTTTITDELKIATNFKGKVVGISLKDRGAILPAGHKADAAYWFEGDNTGKWISSSYYMKQLPKWVDEVNKKNSANTYLNESWNTLLPIKDYTESINDNNPYEGLFTTEKTPTFPHQLKSLRDSNENYSLIKATPFGNNITTEMAIAAIKGEQLGIDDVVDFLAVSYSSTDYVGHQFGPASIEVEDTYLRLDQSLAELINFLESNIGKENILIFLTSDHGAVDVPLYLVDNHFPAGYFDQSSAIKELKTFLNNKWSVDNLIENVSNFQVFLNHEIIAQNKLNTNDIETDVANYMLKINGIAKTFTSNALRDNYFNEGVSSVVQRGFNQTRSGDVLFVLESGWIKSGYKTGTTHGSPYQYDTHVPLIWYGFNINSGETTDKVIIPDIAATLSAILGFVAPSACTGTPINNVLK